MHRAKETWADSLDGSTYTGLPQQKKYKSF